MRIDEFKQLPLMGIIRGASEEVMAPLAETMIAAGLKTVEIAMNTENAEGCIRALKEGAKSQLTVGAGTVMSLDILKRALDAGASFIVLPVLVPGVVAYCVDQKIPVFPGAITPQEISDAWKAGASMVKVFPSKFFGPDYIKEIKGPFDKIELMACGGVSPETIKPYFQAGASAVAFGGSVFRRDWLEARAFDNIGKSISILVKEYESISG